MEFHDFDLKIDNLIEQMPASTGTADSQVDETMQKFKTEFSEIDSKYIDPLVTIVNKKLDLKGYYLDVFKNENTTDDNGRIYVQIVLNDKNSKKNLLQSPYLLVEGYPKTGNVRFLTSGSTDSGTIISLSDVQPNIIETYLSQLISKPFA